MFKRQLSSQENQKVELRGRRFQKDSHSGEETFNYLIIYHTHIKLNSTNYLFFNSKSHTCKVV